MKAELNNRFDTEPEAQAFLEKLLDAKFTISNVTKKPTKRNPSPPFTTSTLQQDANSKLGFGSKATMGSAQKLYQEGRITYMRTDSMSLSGQAIASAANFIKSKFGEEYSQVRNFKTKSAGAQEAHEAIRPTDMSLEQATSDEYAQKLYSLIRNRTLASQMTPAELEKTVITIDISTTEEKFEAKGEVIIFDGFLKVYGGGKKDPEILPEVNSGDNLTLDSSEAKQLFARPPARYTEGSLVKKLEELGIGRPSTYATIISTVLARGYAEKGESEGEPRDIIVLKTDRSSVVREVVEEKTGSDRGKLVPTPAGKLISDFLTGYFDKIVDYDFTANVEKEFDEIQANKLDRNEMLKKFYKPFHALIEKSGGIDRSKVSQTREVGKHPKSGKPILARFGRYGPMLQLGTTEDKENKPQFAPMPKGSTLEKVTIEQALKAFELPRLVGQTEDGKDIHANVGRFGPYIKVDKLFVSIKPLDPYDITHEQALDLYATKLKAEAEKNIADWGNIKIIKGPYGPYIKDVKAKKNAKIPKDTEPKDITEVQAVEILAKAPAKKGRRRYPAKKKK
jgi:DNA topoisomerase-1